jgi:thioesterase domain-containing protein/acyl carrier protein
MLSENKMPEDSTEPQKISPSPNAVQEWLVVNIATACQVPADEIDVQLPLTSLGLESLTLFTLAGELASWLDRDIPTTLLWEYPTIADIAEHLGQPQSQDDTSPHPAPKHASSSLVTLQGEGHLPPLFLVHDVSGTVWCYTALLHHLGHERPVYGFQIPLRKDEILKVPPLAELAATYVSDLRLKQPSGPYFLGGFSMGGVIAFEMARQLRQSGQEVGLLALMDSRFPGLKARKPSFWLTLRLHARNVQSLTPMGKVRYIIEHPPSSTLSRLRLHTRTVRSLIPTGKARSVSFQPSHRSRISEAKENEVGQQPLRDTLLKSKMSDQLGKALDCYTPAPYEGCITFLSARWQFTIRDDYRAWRRVALGGRKRHFALGSHSSIVREPHVRHVAALLNQCLSEAQK